LQMAVFGGIGVGLVWGWLIGKLDGKFLRPTSNGLVIGIITSLLGFEILFLVNMMAIMLFIVATIFALSIHIIWRRSLLKSLRGTTSQVERDLTWQ
jgi:hypothetical protein